jgi:predicted nucleotidyltransferase
VLVLKYGSDPLKTYLPDSDIDITVVPLVNESPDKQQLGSLPALAQLKM